MPEGAGSDWDRTTVWPECVGQQRRNRHEGEQGQPWLSSNRTGRHGITLMHRRPPRPMSHTSGELVEDMVRSRWVYRKLRNFRAGIEAGISCLKRAYGLARCTWRGLDHFKAYVWSSVVAYNLVVFVRLRPS